MHCRVLRIESSFQDCTTAQMERGCCPSTSGELALGRTHTDVARLGAVHQSAKVLTSLPVQWSFRHPTIRKHDWPGTPQTPTKCVYLFGLSSNV
jgi:hypothetical protein